MPLATVTWTNDLSVGVPELDKDHQRLIDLLNTIFTACFAGVGDEYVLKTLDELVDYTREHFEREIALLTAHGYPECAAHGAEHKRLVDQLMAKCEVARGEVASGLSVEVMDFLRAWLIDHILGYDKVYAEYLRNKN